MDQPVVSANDRFCRANGSPLGRPVLFCRILFGSDSSAYTVLLLFPCLWQIDLEACQHGDDNGWAVERLDALCVDVSQPIPPSAVKRRRVKSSVGRAGTSAALDGRWLEVDLLGLCEVVG